MENKTVIQEITKEKNEKVVRERTVSFLEVLAVVACLGACGYVFRVFYEVGRMINHVR